MSERFVIRVFYRGRPNSNVGAYTATFYGGLRARRSVTVDQAKSRDENIRAAAEKLAGAYGLELGAQRPPAGDEYRLYPYSSFFSADYRSTPSL